MSLLVLDVVGLTPRLLPHLPNLRKMAEPGFTAQLDTVFPAVTCSVQSTFLTGLTPAGHGIVGNGWYHRELAEVQFWKQSNHIVHGRKIWEDLRSTLPGFTCAKLF